MPKRSLFAILCDLPWWVSLLVAALVFMAGATFSVLIGAAAALPFICVAIYVVYLRIRRGPALDVAALLKALRAVQADDMRAMLAEVFTADRYALSDAPAGDLRVVAAHLGLRFGERREQVAALCRAIDGERPTVLMGDFNDWIRYRSVQAVLESQFAESTHLRTYPARMPLVALDRIFCRPRGLLKAARTITSAPLLSDHLPLLAELDLDPPAGKAG